MKILICDSKRQNSVKILLKYWKIIGLFSFKFKSEEKINWPIYGLFYSIILYIGYSYLFYSIARSEYSLFSNQKMKNCPMSLIADSFAVAFQFAGVMAAWIISMTRAGYICRIIQKFVDIEVSMNRLNIADNLSDSIAKLKFQCAIVNFSNWSLCSFVLILKYSNMGNLVWAIFNCGTVVITNILLIFANLMMNIKKRYVKINYLIMNWTEENCKKSNEMRRGSDDLFSFLDSLIRIHADLHDLLCMIVNIFAIPIILILCQAFFGFCACSYMFYMSLKDEDSWYSQNMLLIEPISYVIVFSSQILIIGVIPNSTTEVANYTGNFLHQMTNERHLRHSLDTVKSLSLRLFQQPVKMTLHGFIELDYSLIYKIISTITSFIIIMLQLDYQAEQLSLLQSSQPQKANSTEIARNITIT